MREGIDLKKRRFVVRNEGLPDLPGMMLTIVDALKEIGGSAHIHELDEKVIEIEGLSEEEQSHPMSGGDSRLRVNYYLAWARTYLKRGNALENSSRGIWALTPTGSEISELAETRRIYDQINKEEREKARLKRANTAKGARIQADDANFNQDELLDTEEESDGHLRDWRNLLLEVVGDMNPSAFERLSQRLLRESGFTKVEVRGKSGDGGIDGVGVLRVNLVSFQVYFQCKKWKGSVGSKEIRDFRGALQGRADKGLFITTGTFTSQASDEATRDGAIAIDLIDGERLCDLLKENKLGVETKLVEKVKIDRVWFSEV